ncbi:BREX-1 system adenine-specific DNA-methyltransferase PglX [Lacrimispora defluvii]|uniref:site-specific DNA-methyltransferase (adenine-specific) n=1 Tax=Lacrimispora defluvii TaxID=2719233 RepID=A0ABX1VZL6_9FIRM|nr:BREX-1 system adenine-specific DNA-methyltransferase PglX [Lacrimispora defluvii]NNJ33244.1 BREX-1 system adenine-specific DNA-methyltransferase PglX [Lacrimispora defluvii]
MGSAHILIYAFEVLMEIYRECRYIDKDAAVSIIENNLYGLEIDDRAYQMAYFALMMKARSYHKSFLKLDIEPNVRAIKETQEIDVRLTKGIGLSQKHESIVEYLYKEFENAKEIGSLQLLETYDYIELMNKIKELSAGNGQIDMFTTNVANEESSSIIDLIQQAIIMKNKYAAVVTNPPYLNKFEGALKDYVNEHFSIASGDLYSSFILRNTEYCVNNGYAAFMTPFVWMFNDLYEDMRAYILTELSVSTLIQLEYSAYEEATVPICTFVLEKTAEVENGLYIKLSDFKGNMDIQKNKVLEGIKKKVCDYFYLTPKTVMHKMPGFAFAFWITEEVADNFSTNEFLNQVATTKQGLKTGNKDLFLRLWFEVDRSNIGSKTNKTTKWYPCNKGGLYRKWYGNNIYVIDWENNGEKIKTYKDQNGKLLSRPQNLDYNFREGITWSTVSSGPIALRYSDENRIYESKGSGCFPFEKEELFNLLGYLNSVVGLEFIKAIAPTIDYSEGSLLKIPYHTFKNDKIAELVKNNIDLAKLDWDEREISPDFKTTPIFKYMKEDNKIENLIELWKNDAKVRFETMRLAEEEINAFFIKDYKLENTLSNIVKDNDIKLIKVDKKIEIQHFLSYIVGCILGRYQIQEITEDENIICKNGIVIITEEGNTEDSLTNKVLLLIRMVFGEDAYEENIHFISQSLGYKNLLDKQAIYKYFTEDFYAFHCKLFSYRGAGKRPIYWMFDSGKENGFKALVYLHRYNPDTIALLRISYLHKMQNAYENAISSMAAIIESEAPQGEKTKAMKQKEKYMKQLEEIRVYDHAVAHIANQRIDLDLDDGVKDNYEKFQGIETSIDGHKNIKIDLLAKI